MSEKQEDEEKIYICHAKTGNVLLTFMKHKEFIVGLVWSPDNQLLPSLPDTCFRTRVRNQKSQGGAGVPVQTKTR